MEKLIKDTLNPFTILKIEFLTEDSELLKEKIENAISKKGNEFDDMMTKNTIIGEISNFEYYIFVRNNILQEFKEYIDMIGIDFNIKEIKKDIWEMRNTDDFLSHFIGDDNPEITKLHFPDIEFAKDKAISAIENIFLSNYSIDDVLDKINEHGIESLNSFNKNLLKI